jgi:PIN domain nuclease of toxin-antitoxin system
MASDFVLDSSALLALLNDEPGANVVARLLRNSAMSTVNISEVTAKLDEAGIPEPAIRRAVGELVLDMVPFDAEQAVQAGMLRRPTMSAGLSFGDRACLALAKRLGVPAATADHAWLRVDAGVELRLIR